MPQGAALLCALCTDDALHFTWMGEPPQFMFGEYELTVDADIENAVLAADEIGIDTEFFF